MDLLQDMERYRHEVTSIRAALDDINQHYEQTMGDTSNANTIVLEEKYQQVVKKLDELTRQEEATQK